MYYLFINYLYIFHKFNKTHNKVFTDAQAKDFMTIVSIKLDY